MGCVQARPSSNSMTNSSLSSPAQGLDKPKQQSGYVPRHRGEAGAFVSHRRSTSQRYASLQENQGRRVAPHRPQPQNLSDDLVGGSGGGGVEGKLGAIGSSGSTVGDVKRSDGSGDDELVVDGWPKWLIDNVPKHVLKGLVPRSADSYDKIDKVGQGTYSNVYKARDRETGKLVALKKVRFDTSEPESIKFMAREIMILRELDHPNVVKLQGLATSRMHFSLYLVFDFMHSDLQRVIMRPEGRLSEPQVKCYMHQLLSGLQHCHDKGILHRDIKGSNLLIDKTGMLKIADFGLANYYKPRDHRRPLTNRVVTLWYRAPELLLGTTDYGVGIDLWSAGCLLAEMFAGHPIMPGRTEVEQLHKIFKLCGTPPEEYWKKMKLRTTFRPWQSYKCSLAETFEEFPSSSISLLSSLLALDPTSRGSACSALQREFFYTSPLACDLTGLPVIYKEEDDDEMIQPSELRIRRRSKSKRRLNAQRESRKKDLIARNLTRDAESTKNEQDKSAETINRVQEPGSGTSSNSSGRKTTQPDRNLATSPPRVVIISPDFANADEKKHLVPPLPVTKARMMQYRKESDGVYALSQVRRSASMREFRKLNQTKHLARYAVED